MQAKEYDDGHEVSRNLTAIAIILFILLVGVPIWWKTTDVYRAPLPYDRILSIPEISTEDVYYDVMIMADSSISKEESELLLVDLKLIWERANKVKLNIWVTNKLPGDFRENQLGIWLSRNCIDDNFIYDDFVITVCLKEDTIKELFIDVFTQFANSFSDVTSVSQCSMPSHTGYQLSFTLILPYEESSKVLPPFYEDIQLFQDVVLKLLLSFADVRMNSQLIHFSVIDDYIKKVSKSKPDKAIYLKDLSAITNNLESLLISYVSQRTRIHFIIYIPRHEDRPISFKSSPSSNDKFHEALITDWGSIILTAYEPNTTYNTVTFASLEQLKLLLKFPFIQPHFIKIKEYTSLTELEITTWLFRQTLCFYRSARKTLISLVKSIYSVPYMVISDEIQQHILQSLDALNKCFTLRYANKTNAAYLECKSAYEYSEKAYYDPSILSLLYFPEDQKYAIYVPLFLPIGVILLCSVPPVISWIKRRRKMINTNPTNM